MIDWTRRIDHVMFELKQNYGVEDRQAVQILLAALVDCPHTEEVWLVLETGWFARECDAAWFGFGGIWKPHSFAAFRTEHSWKTLVSYLNSILNAPQSKQLFIEPEGHLYSRVSRFQPGRWVQLRSLRIRTETPQRADPMATLDLRKLRGQLMGLETKVMEVLRDPTGSRGEEPPRFVAPPQMLYHTELVQHLSAFHRDWRQLVRALGSLAIRHARLFGRTEVGPEDWRIMARAARDSVPVWIHRAFETLRVPRKTHTVEAAMALKERHLSGYDHNLALAEIQRLEEMQLITNGGAVPANWSINSKHRRGVEQILAGHAFEEWVEARPYKVIGSISR